MFTYSKMDKVREELQLYDRIPDFNTKHRPDFSANRYISIQDRVNNDENFEKEYIEKLISEGWYKLEDIKSILDEKMSGRNFKYRLNGNSLSKKAKGTFRSGGFIIGKNKNDENYVMYKAYNGCIFPLQLNDVEEIYVKDPNVKIEGNKREKIIKNTVYFKTPEKATNYPVYLLSKHTNQRTPIYYAKDNYTRDRFMGSKKFVYAQTTEDWEFE